MVSNYTIKKLSIKAHLREIMHLTMQLEHGRNENEIEDTIKQMFKMDNYDCFGFYDGNVIVGLASFWTLIKLYSGKQLELDNVIIDNKRQSMGYGKIFFNLIEEWAKKRGYNTLELNTYITNARSHKFYFNKDFTIKGYHFLKVIN